ncbi:low temperature requirement protein A [Cellulomonas hominis]
MAGLVPTRLRRMTPRDPHDPERVASPLELLFDLVFASAFDTDDWLYRLTTIVQMAGVLVLAAGVEDVMAHGDFVLVTVGYVIMRLAMVGQWVRLALSSPEYRATAVRFAVGITVVQVLWVLRLALPGSVSVETFVVLAVAEGLVPVVGERAGGTPWHPHHIAERYGLFTMILLSGTLFAAAGAVSAGVEVAVAHELGHTGLGDVGVAATLTVPVALLLLSVWWLGIRRRVPGPAGVVVPAGAVVVAVATVTPAAAAVTAVTLVAVVGCLVVFSLRGTTAPVTPPGTAAR